MPLTGQMLPGTLPFYPSLTVIEREPTYVHKQMQNMEQAIGNRQHSMYHGNPITDTQVAHARLHKAGHRTLGSMFTLCLPNFIFVKRSWKAVLLEKSPKAKIEKIRKGSQFSSIRGHLLPRRVTNP